MKKYVIVVAGGKGLRMGGEIPKQFIPVKGKPVLMRTLETFHACDPNIELIVVLPVEQRSYWEHLCAEYGYTTEYVLSSLPKSLRIVMRRQPLCRLWFR